MTRYIKSDELYHFGRSKKDGAPGVGTGNWRRKYYTYSDGSLKPEGIQRYRKGLKKIHRLKTYDSLKSDFDLFYDQVDAARTEYKMQKIKNKIERDLGKTMSELEVDYGEDTVIGIKHKRMVDDLIDRYSDTCAGEDRSYGKMCAEQMLKELFPNSGESIKKLIETDSEEEK